MRLFYVNSKSASPSVLLRSEFFYPSTTSQLTCKAKFTIHTLQWQITQFQH